MRRAALVLISLIAAVSACGTKAATKPQQVATPNLHACGQAGPAPARYDHVVWIVMENKSYSDVMSSSSAAPFQRSIAAACGVATAFHAEAHPSLPNYLAMTSGSTHGVHDDAAPSAHRIRGASIFSQVGSSWRALQESMPKPCDRTGSRRYAPKHNPAAYYTSLAKTCSKQDVKLGDPPDLSARFTFITPDLCHDSHSCGLGTGDRYLAGLVPEIVGSSQYQAGRTALFITYDEDDGGTRNHIPTLVIAPQTPAGTRSAGRFTHYSLLRTTEEMLGLKKLGAAAGARSMRAAFGL